MASPEKTMRTEEREPVSTNTNETVSGSRKEVLSITLDSTVDESSRKRIRYEVECSAEAQSVQGKGSDEKGAKEEKEASIEKDQAIFCNETILLEILKKLPTKDLFSCRKVNSFFKQHASQVLQDRTDWAINFKFDWTRKIYFKSQSQPKPQNTEKDNENDDTNLSLTRLFVFLNSSPNFPCTSFIFCGGTLTSGDLQWFLTSHGKRIRRLLLGLFDTSTRNPNDPLEEGDTPTVFSLRKLLQTQAPNLEVLVLYCFPPEWKSLSVTLQRDLIRHQNDPEKELCLPNLKYLTAPTIPQRMLEHLLRASVNLKQMHICSSLNMLPLLKIKRSLIAPKMQWMPSREEILESFKVLPIRGSKVWEMLLSLAFVANVPELWPYIAKVVQNILQESSTTLQHFTLASTIGFLDNETRFSFPPLPSVTLLRIGSPVLKSFRESRFSKLIFPAGMKLEKTFPNLGQVFFYLPHLDKYAKWQDYFDGDLNPVLTVKNLTLEKTETFPLDWMTRMTCIFPNIEYLGIRSNYFNYLHAARRGLWNFKKLKRCYFEIHLPTMIKISNVDLAFESAFTGFSVQTVRAFRAKTTSEDDFRDPRTLEEMAKKLREFPSILDVPELEHLHINFMDESGEVRASYPELFTHVTGLFAFKMSKRLRVFFGIQVQNPENLKLLRSCWKYVVKGMAPKHDATVDVAVQCDG